MTTTTFAWPFDTPFFTSEIASSDEVPGRYEVGINGRGYMLDLASNAFTHTSTPISRAQLDTSPEPSEASLSRDDPWRRAWESWHHGAGQRYRDRQASDPARFWTSRGVDVWRRDSLRLLPDTTRVVSSANTNLKLCVLGTSAYVLDGANVQTTTDGTTWTTATGTSGSANTSIVNDGQYVYVTDGANIYRATPGGAFASWNPLDASLLSWNNGRLMAAGSGATANVIYNVIDATAPAALFTHPQSAWTWTAFASGPTCIYASGYVGDTSLIYKIDIKTDGTGLDVPIVAFELPDGEQCLSLQTYLGYLVAGTSAGLRLVNLGDTLTAGPPLTLPAVRCLEGQDRYVWFGWTNYDGNYTGLGRASLVPGIDESAFTDTLTPAYASDLMATSGTQGTVTSVVTYAGRRMFAVSGNGVWLESATNLAATGEMNTGYVTYGLPDNKVIESVEVRMMPLDGTITVSLATTDTGAVALAPVVDTPESTSALLWAPERVSDRVEMTLALTRSAADPIQGPIISRVTMFALPSPPRSSTWQLPLLLAEKTALVPQNTYRRYDAQAERDYIALLCESAALTTVQIGGVVFTGTIADWEWHATHRYIDNSDFSGTLLVTVKLPRQGEH